MLTPMEAMKSLPAPGLPPMLSPKFLSQPRQRTYKVGCPPTMCHCLKIFKKPGEKQEPHIDDIIVSPNVIHQFEKGKNVRIIDGNFNGVEGKVARYHGQQRVAIIIDGALLLQQLMFPVHFWKKYNQRTRISSVIENDEPTQGMKLVPHLISMKIIL